MTSVLLVDDQRLVRTGFRLILDLEPDLTVVGEASDGAECLQLTAREDPDVVLMDIRMPVLDGIETTRRLVDSGSRAKILVLTTFDLDEYVYEAMLAGANGFLLKDAPREQLTAAIRAVAAGDALLAPSVTRRLIERFVDHRSPNATRPDLASLLTPREVEVLRLVTRGHTNAEIARALFVEESTVKTHVARLLAKLGVRDRIQAVIFAYETGFIQPTGLEEIP
ncbi:MAG TPA: response regulator transcription factor [Microbacteriaceae bacterium]|jgi:DNA-binding NarL/FixJ family response regulator|nr:response regulator transcription factor [Microbacteriaceae bacterium]